jgi:hypothetical protein
MLDELEIDRLRIKAAKARSKTEVIEMIKKLGEYAASPFREKAIDAICFIIASGIDLEAKNYALDVIQAMREL